MTEQSGNPDPGDTLLELRAEYWSKRLDHTLTHTQTSSRLIYLVDGAVLALIYFAIQAFGATRQVVGFASLPMFVLVGLNAMHALIIKTQQRWYGQIDAKLMALLVVDAVPHVHETPRWWRSTHEIYQWMHWFIAVVLAAMASLMVAYGLGCFSDLPVR